MGSIRYLIRLVLDVVGDLFWNGNDCENDWGKKAVDLPI